MKTSIKNRKAYLVGGGIASLASAAYLIRDGNISGKNITIFEELKLMGGALDAQDECSGKAYTMRGYRAFEEKAYTCTFDLLSFIPSLSNPQKTVKEEFFDFNKRVKTHAKSRLVENGKIIEARLLGLSWKDRYDLFRITFRSENSIGSLRIKDYFAPSFFKTNFWIEVCTVFSFQPWHSLAEFRRYIFRFIQDFPCIDTLKCIRSTPYNQYEFIVLPLLEWLKKQGVCFKMDARATNLVLKPSEDIKTVESFSYVHEGNQGEIIINENDYVFVTLGSITAGSSIGSMSRAPSFSPEQPDTSWDLWKNISKDRLDFGKPAVFNSHINKTKWGSFTITFQNSIFLELMKDFTDNEVGSGCPITFKDSNWLMSIVLPHQPYFINQPKNLIVCWGYGLFPDKKGNYVKKKMSECSGEEILTELCSHLGFNKKIKLILETATCIPCVMPYITSQFLPRAKGDRPLVIPKGSTNLAFVGQYCEIPNDVVFTLEYSIRSAQTGVYSLLGLDKKASPLYKGQYNIKVVYNAIKTICR